MRDSKEIFLAFVSFGWDIQKTQLQKVTDDVSDVEIGIFLHKNLSKKHVSLQYAKKIFIPNIHW